MATITVRDLDEATRNKLRIRAARNGRSMEAEVRTILEAAVAAQATGGGGLGARLHAVFADIGGADDLVANLPRRDSEPRFVDFSGPEFGSADR